MEKPSAFTTRSGRDLAKTSRCTVFQGDEDELGSFAGLASHALKNCFRQQEHADSGILLGLDLNRDPARFRKRI